MPRTRALRSSIIAGVSARSRRSSGRAICRTPGVSRHSCVPLRSEKPSPDPRCHFVFHRETWRGVRRAAGPSGTRDHDRVDERHLDSRRKPRDAPDDRRSVVGPDVPAESMSNGNVGSPPPPPETWGRVGVRWGSGPDPTPMRTAVPPAGGPIPVESGSDPDLTPTRPRPDPDDGLRQRVCRDGTRSRCARPRQ